MPKNVFTKTLMGGGLVAVVALAGVAHAAGAPGPTAPAASAPAAVRAATLAEAAFDDSGDAYRVSSADDPTGVHDLVQTSLRTIHDHEEHPDD